MSSSEVGSGIGQLREALEKLQLGWSEALEHWRDANAQSFEKNHLRPIASEVMNAYSVIQRLADVMKQAERDCEPW